MSKPNEQTTITAATVSGMGIPEIIALIPQHAADPAILAVLQAALTAKTAKPATTQKIRVQHSAKNSHMIGLTGPAAPGSPKGIGLWTTAENWLSLLPTLTSPAFKAELERTIRTPLVVAEPEVPVVTTTDAPATTVPAEAGF